MWKKLWVAPLLAGAALTANTSQAFCLFNCDYTKTKYPVVFAPGVLGFDKLFGFVDYWYGVPGALRDGGGTVYITSASALNSSEVRGEQMLKQVQDILTISGAQKINIIAHSHGGFSARYVNTMLPGRVASITTMASPAKGSPVADVVRGAVKPGSMTESVLTSIADSFARLVTYFAGNNYPESSLGLLGSVTTQAAADFAKRHPDGVPTTACGEGDYSKNGVRFYSMSGIKSFTNVLDPLDYMFAVTGLAFNGTADAQNDGFIGRCSSHFGKVIRDDYPWNHPDEINHTLAIRGLFTPSAVDVYRQHVNRLKTAGL